MASSGEEYLVARQKQIDRKKRIVTWVSIVSFAGSGIAALAPTLQKMTQNEPPQQQANSPEGALKQQARGFELVLQREPENQVALEGLVKLRIHFKDVRGAVPPMEKLVQLHPDRQDYKTALEQLKKEVSKSDRP